MKLLKVFRVTITCLLVAFFSAAGCVVEVRAQDTIDTSLGVNNAAPTFSVAPAEAGSGSTSSNPTNVGEEITFQATATDGNGGQYYFAVCKTDAIIPNAHSLPVCPGGAWCVAGARNVGTPNDCSYVAQSGDSESNAWYAFACDYVGFNPLCTSSSQGTGDTGSPFFVNHPPTGGNPDTSGSAYPGGNFEVYGNSTDPDTNPSQDTIKVVVCRTNSFTGNDCTDSDDKLCESTPVNPMVLDIYCSFLADATRPEGYYPIYLIYVDNHGAASSVVTSDYYIENVSAVVSNVTINEGSDISLVEGTTTAIIITGTVTDANSCTTIASVKVDLFRSGVTAAGCDTEEEANNNNCYPQVTCTVGASNPCDGDSDPSADFTCTVNMQYFADPTTTGTTYAAQNWAAKMTSTDSSMYNYKTSANATAVELQSLVALDMTSPLSYGTLTVGQSTDPLDVVATITNTGNVAIDNELSGTDMTSGPNSIPIAYQKYSQSPSTAYASATSLSTTPVELEINLAKRTTTATTHTLYFGNSIPSGTKTGAYNGTITCTAVLNETP